MDQELGLHIVGLSVLPREYQNGTLCYNDLEGLRKAIRQAVEEAYPGKSYKKTPLEHVIESGQSVLIKPNWVTDVNKAGTGMECLVTHPNFILIVLEELLCNPVRLPSQHH